MAIAFDPQDPTTNADPFPVFARLREEDPVHWCAPLRGWVVTRYEDVRRVTQDDAMSPDRLTPFFKRLPEADRNRLRDLMHYLNLWMVFRDPPDHTRLRRLVNAAFTTRAVETLRPDIAAIVADLLDGVAETGSMDVIADLAYPLPAMVIMDMLGVPRSDLATVKQWSDDMALFIGGARIAADKYDRAQEGARAMADYFRTVIAERRRALRDDMISALITAREEGGHLTEDEVVATCMLMLFAGHETTTNLIGNGILHLLRHPDQWRRLGDEPAMIQSAVEECLRFDGPSGALARVVAKPHEMGGRSLAEGDRVFAMINAANRDGRQFPSPDEFDIGRRRNRHLTFGYGAHVCLGAALARLEGQVAIGAVVRRFPDMRLAADRFEWLDSLMMRGVQALPVAFTPNAPEGRATA